MHQIPRAGQRWSRLHAVTVRCGACFDWTNDPPAKVSLNNRRLFYVYEKAQSTEHPVSQKLIEILRKGVFCFGAQDSCPRGRGNGLGGIRSNAFYRVFEAAFITAFRGNCSRKWVEKSPPYTSREWNFGGPTWCRVDSRKLDCITASPRWLC